MWRELEVAYKLDKIEFIDLLRRAVDNSLAGKASTGGHVT